MIKPKREIFEGMVFEYILNEDSNKTVVLLDGLPALPYERELMNKIYSLGFSVLFPRYLGTWESEGEFLKENPSLPIDKFLASINTGITIDENTFHSDHIFVLSISFGGSVALCLADQEYIKKIIAASPVVDYTKVTDIDTLSPFLRRLFPGAYRYNEESWEKLQEGNLINPNKSVEVFQNKDKIEVLAGVLDETVLIEDISRFCERFELELERLQDKGHLSFDDIDLNKFLS